MSNIEIQETISQFIENQFPRLYREKLGVDPTESERSVFVDFMEAYYEFLENQFDDNFLRSRKMFEYRDIDLTPDSFIEYFKSKFLKNFPEDATTDERFVIKNILDLYRTKGSATSIKLMIRLLFNEDVEVYFPGQDVLRSSDSRWIDPIYLEVLSSDRSVGLVGKSVFGSISGARAFVEAVVTKRTSNRLIDILYLSGVEGTFQFGDIISDDGVLSGAPKVIGSLSSVSIDQNTVGGNQIGDIFNINSVYGINGQARVTEIISATGGVDFEIVDGGYGYTLTDDTKVYISDIVISQDNSNAIFNTDETVFQKLETVFLENDTLESFMDLAEAGANVIAYDSGMNPVANGVVMESGVDPITLQEFIRIQTDTTFVKQQVLTLTSNTEYRVGRTLVEASDVILDIENVSGSFNVGEIVYQREFLAGTSNTVSSTYTFGEVTAANSTALTITDVFGDFSDELIVIGGASGATANVVSANVTFEGTTGVIVEKNANNQYTLTVETEFTDSSKIRGADSKVVSEIDSSTVTSINTVEIAGSSANVATVANTYFTGLVIGQNTISIGVSTTSNNSFVFVEDITKIQNSDNNTLIVQNITQGEGASFEIGTITNEEIIAEITERIVDENVFGVKYEDVRINGSGTGIGYVNSVAIVDGGTGYTNASTVTFSGGGFADQNPLINAEGTVTTDGTGSIIAINVTEVGEGYFNVPTITVSDGAGADLDIQMTFGYGFPLDVFADDSTVIGDVLTESNTTIGTIQTLTNNTPGIRYTGRPYVRIINPKISFSRKQDQIATISDLERSFAVGEIVTQANTGARGLVSAVSGDKITIRNLSYNEDFYTTGADTGVDIAGKLIGSESSAEAVINNIEYSKSSAFMGENAIIDNFVIESQGVVSKVEVIDSGLGYINGENVSLVNGDKNITGVVTVDKQGIEPGYWKTRTSHISSEKKLHDNDYYQEFSYDIKTAVNIQEYRDIVLDILHLSGTKLFGSVVRSNEEQVTVDVTSTIVQSNT